MRRTLRWRMAGRRTTPRVEAAAVRRYNMAATWLEYAGDINGLQRCGTYLFRCTRLLLALARTPECGLKHG